MPVASFNPVYEEWKKGKKKKKAQGGPEMGSTPLAQDAVELDPSFQMSRGGVGYKPQFGGNGNSGGTRTRGPYF